MEGGGASAEVSASSASAEPAEAPIRPARDDASASAPQEPSSDDDSVEGGWTLLPPYGTAAYFLKLRTILGTEERALPCLFDAKRTKPLRLTFVDCLENKGCEVNVLILGETPRIRALDPIWDSSFELAPHETVLFFGYSTHPEGYDVRYFNAQIGEVRVGAIALRLVPDSGDAGVTPGPPAIMLPAITDQAVAVMAVDKAKGKPNQKRAAGRPRPSSRQGDQG